MHDEIAFVLSLRRLPTRLLGDQPCPLQTRLDEMRQRLFRRRFVAPIRQIPTIVSCKTASPAVDSTRLNDILNLDSSRRRVAHRQRLISHLQAKQQATQRILLEHLFEVLESQRIRHRLGVVDWEF